MGGAVGKNFLFVFVREKLLIQLVNIIFHIHRFDAAAQYGMET